MSATQLESVSKPHGVFRGKNFMTPILLGYYRLKGGAWAELSKDEPPYFPGRTTPMHGVTVRLPGDKRLDPDPSGCFDSQEAAMEAIEALS